MPATLLHELTDVFSRATNRRELETLLEGLLTPQEIEEIVLRWRLMTRLQRGDHQRDIAHDLGVSLGKISRGSRIVQYGPEAFRQLLERISEPGHGRG